MVGGRGKKGAEGGGYSTEIRIKKSVYSSIIYGLPQSVDQIRDKQ